MLSSTRKGSKIIFKLKRACEKRNISSQTSGHTSLKLYQLKLKLNFKTESLPKDISKLTKTSEIIIILWSLLKKNIVICFNALVVRGGGEKWWIYPNKSTTTSCHPKTWYSIRNSFFFSHSQPTCMQHTKIVIFTQ